MAENNINKTKESIDAELKSIDIELSKFLNQNKLSKEDYDAILVKIEVKELNIFLELREKYNINIDKYVSLTNKWDKVTNKNDSMTFDLFVQLNKDRSYQSNMKMMNDLTGLIKSVENNEDTIKQHYEQNGTFKMLKTTSTLTKFRKVVSEYLEKGKLPEEEDDFKQNIVVDLLNSVRTIMDKQETINLLSQESVTAIHTAKDLYCIWKFGNKLPKQVIESYKLGISPKSYSIVTTTFKDLVDRYPK